MVDENQTSTSAADNTSAPISPPAQDIPASEPVDATPAASDDASVIIQPLPTSEAPAEVKPEINQPAPNQPQPASDISTPPNNPVPVLDAKFKQNMEQWKTHLAEAAAKKKQKQQDKINQTLALAVRFGAITRPQVQQALRCSEAAALRYLSALEKSGKLRRTGGHHLPRYEVIK